MSMLPYRMNYYPVLHLILDVGNINMSIENCMLSNDAKIVFC